MLRKKVMTTHCFSGLRRTTFAMALVVTLTACGMNNPLAGGNRSMKTVSELWSDVPKMDGLSPSELEMPIYVKVLMRTALNRIGARDSKDTGDWIVLTTAKTTDDLKSFFTSERMAANGWDKTDKSTCLNGSEEGVPQVGLFCVFKKSGGDKDVGLMIISSEDVKSSRLNVFFVRVEVTADPEIRQTVRGAPKMTDTPASGGAKVPAPYGIDHRPMPAGLDLDQLLPPQIGTYTRESVRMAMHPNVQPVIQTDGESVYAEYRAGSATIFVELGSNSNAAGAQLALDAAVGDAAGGVFPADPHFGARRQEPSYLKVIDADGAFFAWTRGGYYFSAWSKSGEGPLDAFMQAFPF
jgi:hypothetical protein